MSNSKATIIQVAHGYNSPFFQLANRYAELFPAERYEVVTIYLTGEPSAEIERDSIGAKVYFLNLQKRQLKGLKLHALSQLRELIKQHQPTAIIAHRYKSIYLSLLSTVGQSIPVIGVAHAFGVFSSLGRQLFARLFAKRLKLLGVSNDVRNELRSDLAFMPESSIQTQYNCMDIAELVASHVSRESAREALGCSDEQFIFANVGRLHPDKDQPTLIRAFARVASEMPNARLLLVGTGREQEHYQALIDQLQVGEQVKLFGYLKDAERYFRGFDAYVSTSDREPFGMVLVEAMSAQLPVISTNCGGGGEVAAEVGDLFTVGDDQTLSQLLLKLYQLPAEQRAERGRAGLEKCQREYDMSAFKNSFWQWGWIDNAE